MGAKYGLSGSATTSYVPVTAPPPPPPAPAPSPVSAAVPAATSATKPPPAPAPAPVVVPRLSGETQAQADARYAAMLAEQAQRQVDRETIRKGTVLQGTYIAPESSQQYVAARADGQNPTAPAYATGMINKPLVYGISDGGAHATAVTPVDHLYPLPGAAPAPGGGSAPPGSSVPPPSSGGGANPGGTPPAPSPSPSPSPAPAPAPAPAAPPPSTEVTPEMSVEERARRIAEADSPLMQQARGRAMQRMNERGLINSSLGVQAGQDAVMDRAIDIAKADASTEFQNSQNNANRVQQLEIARLQAETSIKNAQLSSETQLSVAEINRQYSQMANLSSTAASLMTAYNNDVNQIVLSDLPAEAKEAAINARTQTLRLSLNVMGSINGDVDMNNLLNGILG